MKKKVLTTIFSAIFLFVIAGSLLFAFIFGNDGYGYFAKEIKVLAENSELQAEAQNAVGTVYNPASYILAEGADTSIGTEGETDYSSNIFRGDAAYNTRWYDRMTKVSNSGTTVTIGDVSLGYSNWTRYCAFMAKTGETVVTSKMSTGVNQSNNRLVFMAPYSGYYEIVPRSLSSDSTASVALDLGTRVAEFEDNTANFKILNPQTNEVYSDITFYAENENGDSNLTGNINNTQNIYLNRGEKIYILTSTTVDWFDYDYKQTVFVKFDLGIALKEVADSQKTYTLKFEPAKTFMFADADGDAMGETAPFTVKTKYYSDADYTVASTTREIEENLLAVGNNDKVNWDKYSALWVNTQTGIASAKLVNKNSGVKLIFTSPVSAAYKLEPVSSNGASSLELSLGSFADKFGDSDKATVTIQGNTTHIITLTKASPTADLSGLEFALAAGDTLTFTVETTAEWFDEPENQTVTVNMNFNMVSKFSEEGLVTDAVYDPYETIIGRITTPANTTGDIYAEERLIDYSGSVFQTINRYYTNAAGQYAQRISEEIYTYGKTWDIEKVQRGSFLFEDGSKNITAIMGMTGSGCVQTIRFTAPETGCYAIDPQYLGGGESAWLKCTGKSSQTQVNFKIIKGGNDEIYNSGTLERYDSVVWGATPVVYLKAGETLDFNFSALQTEWNTNPRISVSFDIAKLDL